MGGIFQKVYGVAAVAAVQFAGWRVLGGGTSEVRCRGLHADRIGRNPATGETIKIKAKKVVKFRVAKAAKDAILGVKK